MKGRKPTALELRHIDKTAQLGCIASITSKLIMPFTECPALDIHHLLGKTKKNAHFLVLPLLPQAHNYMHPGSLHNNKAVFEKRYGTERELWHKVQALIYPQGFPQEIHTLLQLERWTQDFFNQKLYEEFLL